jgi:BASS family bile acid:Na+ symporter
MVLITLSSSALGWLGRQGTRAIAAIVFIAIALPPIDALLKPFVTEAIFVLLCIALTALLFARADRERSFVPGLMASQRNMGLMLAVTAGVLPDATWLYFALAQFPIYLSPFFLEPLARRLMIGSGKQKKTRTF